jgi:hypothetical protein
MKIIAVSGQMRNGKNEIGEYICKKMNFTPASFATPVKKIFCDAFSVDMDFVETWKIKSEPPEGFEKNVRQALQFIGDGFRQIFPDVWVEYAVKNNPDYCCYMDGRYINELAKVKQKGGVNILVWRPTYENNDPNQSEAQIRPLVDWFAESKVEGDVRKIRQEPDAPFGCEYIDFFIINDGSLDKLYQKVDKHIISYLPLIFNQ